MAELTPEYIIAMMQSKQNNKSETDLKKIYRLKKEKKLDEAHELAREVYKSTSYPNYKELVRIAYVWILIDKIKNSSVIKDSVKYFKEILLLGEIKDDDIIKKQLVKFYNDEILINNFIVTYTKTDAHLIISAILNIDDINLLNIKNRQYMRFFTQLEGEIPYILKILLIKKIFYFKVHNDFNFSIDELIFFLENNHLIPIEHLSIDDIDQSLENAIEQPLEKELTIDELLKLAKKQSKKPLAQDLSIEAILEFFKSSRNDDNIFIPHQVLTSMCKSIKNKKVQYGATCKSQLEILLKSA